MNIYKTKVFKKLSIWAMKKAFPNHNIVMEPVGKGQYTLVVAQQEKVVVSVHGNGGGGGGGGGGGVPDARGGSGATLEGYWVPISNALDSE